MRGLFTRRHFTLGLAAAAVPLTSRLRFGQAEAVETTAHSAPTAPIVPKRFKAFGGVRLDNYDWLRDRKDPRVAAYLNAENAYAEARLEPIRPLVEQLAAELKAREAQEDASVPTTYNGYLYERRFSQGAQYHLLDGSTHGLWSAKPKVVEVSESDSDHIHRMFGDNVIPDRQAAVDVAGDPGLQCLYMSPFSSGGLHRHRAGDSSRLGSGRDFGQVVGEHREVAGQTVRETKRRVGRERMGEMLRSIGTVFQIRLNRPVKADSRFRGQCRERQPVLVLKHQRTLPTN